MHITKTTPREIKYNILNDEIKFWRITPGHLIL
jgi:hypothetical protein